MFTRIVECLCLACVISGHEGLGLWIYTGSSTADLHPRIISE